MKGPTQVQVIVRAIRDAGSSGITYEDLCKKVSGSWTQVKSRVSLVARTLVEAGVVEFEDTAGHRNVLYRWKGRV